MAAVKIPGLPLPLLPCVSKQHLHDVLANTPSSPGESAHVGDEVFELQWGLASGVQQL